MRQLEQHTLPPPSSDHSDSEDPFGGAEELHLSESEMAPFLSDHEDHTRSLSTSPTPAYLATPSVHESESDGDDDQNTRSFSLSGQEFDQDMSLHFEEENGMQDSFLLVDSSDLPPMSRPLSSLSTHSDHIEHDNPMKLIYPSIDSVQNESEMHEHGHPDMVSTDGEAQANVTHTATSQERSSTPLHSEKRSTSEDHQEVQLESGATNPSHQGLSGDTTPLSGTVVMAPESRPPESNTADQGDGHKLDSATYGGSIQTVSEGPASTSSVDDVQECSIIHNSASNLSNHSSLEIKTLFDPFPPGTSAQQASSKSASVSISPSWGFVNSIIGTIGFLLLLLLTGYLSAQYTISSTHAAHAIMSKIKYMQCRYDCAGVEVWFLTRHFKTANIRSPGLHARVLNDNRPWSLDEAPPQSMELFSKPDIICRGGSCGIFIVTYKKRTREDQSPWLCSDTSYYLHVWFANGTRISDRPPEIFTSRKGRTTKPRECNGQITVVTKIQRMFHEVASLSASFSLILIDAIQEMGDQLSKAEEPQDMLQRARENAKKITKRASLEFQQVADQLLAQMGLQRKPPSWSFTVFKDQFKVDQIFAKAEKLLVDMKTMKKVLVDKIMREARSEDQSKVDQISAKAEKLLVDMKVLVDKIMREARSETLIKRRWKDLKKQLGVV
ncbi:hypothetical protein B0O80DRAFT_147928 [Mortierella sp. GBAus27b]|nr:hypothetical protein BGX31_008667 [Mortierella sp. GBA43]KAI8361016.1 hypothetical protein B0O80DRAFT_147928 [Mortierella sp. GBAus27b]